MIQKTWDNRRILSEFFDCDNFGEVIGKIKEGLDDINQVICEVKLNSEVLTEVQESDYYSLPLEDIHRLDILSEEPSRLFQETLEGTKKFITELQETAYQAGSAYRGKDIKKAAQLFEKLLNTSDWLVEVLVNVEARLPDLGYKVHKIDEVNELWRLAENEFSGVLSKIMSSFKSRDFIGLAGILELEFTNALESWVDYLEALEDGSEEINISQLE